MRGGPSLACRRCGYQSSKWLGRCPECGSWDAFAAAEVEPPPSGAAAATVRPFPEIGAGEARRVSTGFAEFDRVLGGGLVPGAVVLVGGEPGIGKSTLLLQAASAVAEAGGTVVYASGEESPSQLRARGGRLGVRSSKLLVVAEPEIESVLAAVAGVAPALLVVDSIQAVRAVGVSGPPGSIVQVRECAARLVTFAKERSTPTLLVGHVTKDGALAGPRALEHLVDAVLQFEGDRHHEHRILRALKNRFGPSHELGIFTMAERGLSEVADPSASLLAARTEGEPGSAVLASVEGSRPLLVEVQALAGSPAPGTPRRTTVGIDVQRAAMILAVLDRAVGLELSRRDVFVNVTGGLTLDEPAADLAVACAVASSAFGRALPPRTAVAGEIGLTGEVRSVPRLADRMREAARHGMETLLAPAGTMPPVAGLRYTPVARLADAFAVLFGC